MKHEIEDPAKLIREMVSYNPETGVLIWIARPCPKIRIGSIASRKPNRDDRYRVFKLNKRAYQAHRVAWLLHYGDWPALELDHINGDKDDNRISNLRLATRSQNMANRKVRAESRTGIKGVRPYGKEKFAAVFMKKHLGAFDTPEEASEAYAKAAESLFGEFARVS